MLLGQDGKAEDPVAYTVNPEVYVCTYFDGQGHEIRITEDMVRRACTTRETAFRPVSAQECDAGRAMLARTGAASPAVSRC